MTDTRARFEMYQNNNLVWSIDVTQADVPMLAGLGDSFTYLLETLGTHWRFQCVLFNGDGTQRLLTLKQIYLFDDAERIGNIQRGFLTLGDNAVGDIRNRFVILRKNTDDEDEYTVLAFSSPRFIQGFIMGCNACGVDFRTVLHGLPFKINPDESLTYYDIPGYLTTNAEDMPGRLV